jgi:16S rRNA (uracil1498-N3)-methyltransferase
MIDGLSQVGAAAWVCLESARTVVHPREAKLARVERVAVESLKQCGRAWLLETGAKAAFSDALGQTGTVVIADTAGNDPLPTDAPDLAPDLALFIGPEGGWTPEELAAARAVGAKVCRFGAHTMRIETAAVVACARLLPVG